MADYNKKVVYLSYLEQGSKIRGAGFVKVEATDGKWSADMHVSGMTELAEKRYDVYVIDRKGKEYKAGNIFLHRGKGEWKRGGEGNNLETDKLSSEEIGRFIIKISETEMIEGKYQEADRIGAEECLAKENERQFSHMEHSPQEKEKRMQLSKRPDFPEGKKKQGASRESSRQEEKPLKVAERVFDRKKQTNREVLGGQGKEIRMEEIILDDKWKQLCQMYPVVHPYEDEREYISIQPKDFVIMTGDYQHLANNSFLLHGFYNYRHIVLGREQGNEAGGNETAAAEIGRNRKTESRKEREAGKGENYGNFYLGVPGVYYEREKMVALMFGFEAFECCGGKAEPGKFGYYLRKVKI